MPMVSGRFTQESKIPRNLQLLNILTVTPDWMTGGLMIVPKLMVRMEQW